MIVIKKQFFLPLLVSLTGSFCFAQTTPRLPEKVSHAEPLYLDLVRDLGARKGELEFNLGADFENQPGYRQSAFLAEVEFAPVNRLGIELEADFSFYRDPVKSSETPSNKLEYIRLSTQYSFLVSVRHQTTLAAGYTQILELTDFNLYGKTPLISGTAYNPFFVAAKRWSRNQHTLLYVGPVLQYSQPKQKLSATWQINASYHYMLPKTKHFIGIEVYNAYSTGYHEIIIRPQAKMKLSEHLAVGMVTGIPLQTGQNGISSFFRIIYEP